MEMLIAGVEYLAKPGKSAQLAAQIVAQRDAVAAATGQAWSVWAVLAGRPYGTFLSSTRFEGLAALVAAQQAIAASPAWQATTGPVGDLLAVPVATNLSDVVAMTGEPTAPKQFVMVTQVQIMERIADAFAWSVRVIEHVKSVTGVDTLVTSSTAGPMFRISFVAGVDTAAELDNVNAALAADATYLAMLDETADFFVPGSAERAILMKMA